MKYTISREAGMMAVGNDVRPIDTSTMTPIVSAVTWDTVAASGWIQFDEDVMIEAQERDLVREAELNAELAAQNKLPLEDPLYKTVQIHRPPEKIESFGPYASFLTQWENYVPPPPPPPPPPPDPRVVAIEADFRTGTYGGVQPATLEQLKAMTVAEYNAWFTANFTNAAQALALLRRVTLLIIRRLL